MNSVYNINLFGLPGAGKSRVKKSLYNLLKQRQLNNIKVFTTKYATKRACNWLVIDVRSKLEHAVADKLLIEMANNSSLIIFCFMENSSLDVQMFWQKWVINNTNKTPALRMFFKSFQADFMIDKYLQPTVSLTNKKILNQKLQTLYFAVNILNLEHFLIGLDGCKNLQMDIWRIKGTIKTTEYIHPVAIEGTINRWDTYPSNKSNNKVVIKGKI